MRRLALLLGVLLAGAAPAAAQRAAKAVPDWGAIGQEAARILSAYIRIDNTNPPGHEARAAAFLEGILEKEGIAVTVWEPAPGKANLLARLPGTGKARPVILLNHMDVVPASPEYWSVDPFAGVVRDGYVWGRGALDMKGLGVAQLMALLTLKRQGIRLERDVIFLATADEEVGGTLGAGDVVAHHFEAIRDAEFVLNEGGDIAVSSDGRVLYYGIGTTEKSPFWIDVVARGQPGHGSVPREGSAPNRLVRALERIRTWAPPVTLVPVVERYFRDLAPIADPSLRRAYAEIDRSVRDPVTLGRLTGNAYHNALLRNTISITVLEGSSRTNVIPPEARAELDVRLLPGEDPQAFLAELRRVVADDSVELRPQGIGWPATVSPTDTRLFRALETVAKRHHPGAIVTTPMLAGFTDCHFFREQGIACYGVDPFKLTDAESRGVHGNDERISIENLAFGSRFIFEVLVEVGR